MEKVISPELLEKLAEEFADLHHRGGIELEYWDTAREFVSHFYDVYLRVEIGYKK